MPPPTPHYGPRQPTPSAEIPHLPLLFTGNPPLADKSSALIRKWRLLRIKTDQSSAVRHSSLGGPWERSRKEMRSRGRLGRNSDRSRESFSDIVLPTKVVTALATTS